MKPGLSVFQTCYQSDITIISRLPANEVSTCRSGRTSALQKAAREPETLELVADLALTREVGRDYGTKNEFSPGWLSALFFRVTTPDGRNEFSLCEDNGTNRAR
jgi:hypothetical protein